VVVAFFSFHTDPYDMEGKVSKRAVQVKVENQLRVRHFANRSPALNLLFC
jgi:hypothetical protein